VHYRSGSSVAPRRVRGNPPGAPIAHSAKKEVPVAGFINKLPGGIEVIHLPAAKDWGDVDLSSPPKGCGHTTEGTSLPSYREGQRDAPTFTVGFDKV
jgi:hypothetical protein